MGSQAKNNFLLISESFMVQYLLLTVLTWLLCLGPAEKEERHCERESRSHRDPDPITHLFTDKHFWRISCMPGTVLGYEDLAGNTIESPVEALGCRFLVRYCTQVNSPAMSSCRTLRQTPFSRVQESSYGPWTPLFHLLSLWATKADMVYLLPLPTSLDSTPGSVRVLWVILSKSFPSLLLGILNNKMKLMKSAQSQHWDFIRIMDLREGLDGEKNLRNH